MTASLVGMGCAGSRVTLKSDPAGAQVQNFRGEVIGTTPLVLQGDRLDQAKRNGRLVLTVSHPQHLQRELVLDVHGEDSYEVALTRLDEDYFHHQLLKHYPRQSNELIRDLLQIQGYLVVNKVNEAQSALSDFQKRFPNIAAAYVLSANVALIKGDKASARSYLLRAQSLDPDDPVVARMLGPAESPKINRKGASRP